MTTIEVVIAAYYPQAQPSPLRVMVAALAAGAVAASIVVLVYACLLRSPKD